MLIGLPLCPAYCGQSFALLRRQRCWGGYAVVAVVAVPPLVVFVKPQLGPRFANPTPLTVACWHPRLDAFSTILLYYDDTTYSTDSYFCLLFGCPLRTAAFSYSLFYLLLLLLLAEKNACYLLLLLLTAASLPFGWRSTEVRHHRHPTVPPARLIPRVSRNESPRREQFRPALVRGFGPPPGGTGPPGGDKAQANPKRRGTLCLQS